MIKWIKIQHICQKMCNRDVHLHSSTDMPDDQIAGTEFNDQSVAIILNMHRTKSLGMVIKAVAHEMTHVMLGTQDHNITFDAEWKKNEIYILQQYNL